MAVYAKFFLLYLCETIGRFPRPFPKLSLYYVVTVFSFFSYCRLGWKCTTTFFFIWFIFNFFRYLLRFYVIKTIAWHFSWNCVYKLIRSKAKNRKEVCLNIKMFIYFVTQTNRFNIESEKIQVCEFISCAGFFFIFIAYSYQE